MTFQAAHLVRHVKSRACKARSRSLPSFIWPSHQYGQGGHGRRPLAAHATAQTSRAPRRCSRSQALRALRCPGQAWTWPRTAIAASSRTAANWKGDGKNAAEFQHTPLLAAGEAGRALKEALLGRQRCADVAGDSRGPWPQAIRLTPIPATHFLLQLTASWHAGGAVKVILCWVLLLTVWLSSSRFTGLAVAVAGP